LWGVLLNGKEITRSFTITEKRSIVSRYVEGLRGSKDGFSSGQQWGDLGGLMNPSGGVREPGRVIGFRIVFTTMSIQRGRDRREDGGGLVGGVVICINMCLIKSHIPGPVDLIGLWVPQ